MNTIQKLITERQGLPEYSGKFILRTNPQLHQRLSIAAMLRHQSLNKYCIEQLELTTH